MRQVKDDSSSLVCLLDSSSYLSSWSGSTDRASLWSRTFTFDWDLLGSNVYKGQFRFLMKWCTRKRATPHRISSVAITDNDLEKGARRQHQVIGDVLLLGPERSSRMQLLYNLQRIFDPAREYSISRACKDEIICYTLPTVCSALRDAYWNRGGYGFAGFLEAWAKSDYEEFSNVLSDRVFDRQKILSPINGHCKRTADTLAMLWKDETTRQVLKNLINFRQENSKVLFDTNVYVAF